MVIFTKKFGTLDPHLPIVWDKVPKKTVLFWHLPLCGPIPESAPNQIDHIETDEVPRASREPRMLEGAFQKKIKKYIYMNLWSFAGKERLRSKTNQSQPEWEKKRQTRRAQKKALALPSR